MFTCKVENTRNNILTLTQDEDNFQVLKITGLNPPKAQINTTKMATLDGKKFNSSTLNERNIVITVKLNGDVEKNRIRLYSFFRPKEWCKFYYKNSSRDVFIEAYTENVECDLFTNNETMQISLLCPEPYFKDVQEIIDDISKILSKFEFPFSIDEDGIEFSTLDTSKITNVHNSSEMDTGVIVDIDIYSHIEKLLIKNTSTGETLTLNYQFQSNDKVTINTNKGHKSIKLIRNAETINIFSAIEKGSTFFKLNIGDNFFSYLADDGENDSFVHIVFRRNTLYGGA